MWRYGVWCRGVGAVLAVLAPVLSLWRVLYLNRGDLEGEGVVVDRGAPGWARGSCWRRSIRGTVAGVAASRPRVLNSAGVVVAVLGVALQGRGWRPRRPDVMVWPCRVMREGFEGAAGPPSWARRVSRTGVGGTASRSWHWPCRTVPHSGGDGFPLGSWRNSAGAWFPGAWWRGSAVSEH
jgi:hypothetical protein